MWVVSLRDQLQWLGRDLARLREAFEASLEPAQQYDVPATPRAVGSVAGVLAELFKGC